MEGSCRHSIRVGYRHTSSRHPLLPPKPSTQAATTTWRSHSTNLRSGLCTLSQCSPRHMPPVYNYRPLCALLWWTGPCCM